MSIELSESKQRAEKQYISFIWFNLFIDRMLIFVVQMFLLLKHFMIVQSTFEITIYISLYGNGFEIFSLSCYRFSCYIC